jgi:dethiobiotin synthetase
VIVEGAGGFLVPLDGQHDMSHLAQQLGLPVILVIGLRLGCLNHALLTAEAIKARGLVLAGWIGNVLDAGMPCLDENIATLRQRLDAPCFGIVPRLANAQDAVPFLQSAFSED